MKLKEQLAVIAKPNCKHCYGRGWVGFNQTTEKLVFCKCAIKVINKWRKEQSKKEADEKKKNANKQ